MDGANLGYCLKKKIKIKWIALQMSSSCDCVVKTSTVAVAGCTGMKKLAPGWSAVLVCMHS